MSLMLRIDAGGEAQFAPRTVEVGGALVALGRMDNNDVVIADGRISGRHGRFVRRGEGYAYEDVGSRNGSLLERGALRTPLRAHEPVAVIAGDRLLLGDLAAPVVVSVERAPFGPDDAAAGATVVAAHAMVGPGATDALDATTLRALFEVVRQVSGVVDPGVVLARIADGVLGLCPQARMVAVLLRDAEGRFVPEFARARSGQAAVQTSEALVKRAVERREVVAWRAGDAAAGAGASVVGLAGAVVAPLVVGDETIGVLQADSALEGFGPSDLTLVSTLALHVAASLAAARRFGALVEREAALSRENAALRTLPRPILGQSEALKASLRMLERVARTQTTVLVQGETGTGKELAARFVHAHSPRSAGPFAAVNCGALPENLLESELFGHRKGAFTGAVRDHAGLFEAADGGTLFLDEIGEVSAAMQVRLLRVLQEREVTPVGASRPVKVDVRVVTATNRDLKAEVAAGRFREDLYYRLAVFPVRLPALRERGGDVELLAETFRQSAVARHGRYVPGFTHEALAALARHDWPGNVRQLEHEIERAVILAADGAPIGLDDLSPGVLGTPSAGPSVPGALALPTGPLHEVMDALELRVVRKCLEDHEQTRTRAAAALGISRQALQVKLAKWRERGERVEGDSER
jgi:transcriptional regulator with GAF, ATPase, and Fis domain